MTQPIDLIRLMLLWIGALGQIAATRLPQMLDLGRPIGERSDALSTPIIPPGWAFSIWGAIFLGCVVLAGYATLPANRARPLVRRATWIAAATFALNIAWQIWVPLNNLDWISVAILGLTVVLLVIALGHLQGARPLSRGDTCFIRFPLSLFAGWVIAAFFIGLSSTLKFYGIAFAQGDTSFGWALGLLTVAVLAASLVTWRTGGWMFALGTGWALSGLSIERLVVADDPLIGGLATAGLVGLLMASRTHNVCSARTRQTR